MKKEPIRVFEGNAKPHEPFWTIKNEEGGDPEIDFWGIISEFSWFGDEITPRLFKDDLYRVGKGGPITVHIDSPGGECYAASVIRAIMLDYPGDITVKIDGICYSAAVMVALAGDRVLMQESGYMMIHEPWIIAVGNAAELRATAKMMDKISEGITDCYETRTKLDRSKLEKMMSDTTFFNARTAKDLGFIDEIIIGSSVATSLTQAAVMNCLKNYEHIPAFLLPKPAVTEKPVVPEVPLASSTAATSPAQEVIPAPEDDSRACELQSLHDHLNIFKKEKQND